MAQLFLGEAAGSWAIHTLSADRYRLFVRSHSADAIDRLQPGLRPSGCLVVEPDRGGRPARKGAILLRRRDPSTTKSATTSSSEPLAWAVLPGPESRLRINGTPVAIGLAVLNHRDELSLDGGTPFYFSSERLVSVETYAAADSPRCPRCTLPIESGQSYVCCPGCGVLHHQLSERGCWEYGPCCAICDQPTDLSAGFRWSPEDL